MDSIEFKSECGKCGDTVGGGKMAYHCTHNCTFCETCTTEMKHVCPNCGGELVLRTDDLVDPKESHDGR